MRELTERLRHVPKGVRADYYHNAEYPNPMRPLLVRGLLATPYVPIDSNGRLHLDGLLSFAFYQHLPFPVTTNGHAVVTPLPLELLWISPEGLPLWAASDLLPQGDSIRGREYWHKRYPTDRSEFGGKANADMRAGRYKEYRMPLQTIRVSEIRAMCIGNQRRVSELLEHVTHVGKKGSQGFGRVVEWQVEPLEKPISKVKPAILRERNVPLGYPKSEPGKHRPRTGWTPPYWYAPWHAACRVPS